MFRLLLGYLIVVLMSLCLLSTAHASTIVFQSGQEIKGEIIERTELRVMVDVHGIIETFFLGEISSIDGQKVSVHQDMKSKAAGKDKKSKPANKTEEESLIKLMNKRNSKAPTQNQLIGRKIPVTQAKNQSVILPGSVVATPDGGIIVVSPEKITKYDKNLNVVKQLDLNPASTAGSK